MRVYRSLAAAQTAGFTRTVATLGVFDGVHRGHQEVLRRLIQAAREQAGESVVVTFGRHPRAVIEGRPPMLLTALRHKLRILDGLGVDSILLLRFDQRLRKMPATTFVREVFVKTLGVARVILGYNNRFGLGGEGDFELLHRLGESLGFQAEQVSGVVEGGHPVSSTAIRLAILQGKLADAARMLGRPFSVLGRVVGGERLGTRLGFPTANLNLHHEVRPPRGVYGCEARLGEERFDALANIGFRPTIRPGLAAPKSSFEERDRLERVEVHLLDWSGNLYGRNLEVVFKKRLRAERRFSSPEALKRQIAADCALFRQWLKDED